MTEQPQLRVVRGNPTDEELAAIIAVVSAASAQSDEQNPPRSEWASPVWQMRHILEHGPGGWRHSGFAR